MENNGVHFMMPTIFNDNNEIDFESMESICNFAKNSGCKGLVLLGVMGEAHIVCPRQKEIY